MQAAACVHACATPLHAHAHMHAAPCRGIHAAYNYAHLDRTEVCACILRTHVYDTYTPTHIYRYIRGIGAYLGFVDACSLLLDAGAEVDAVDSEVATPLYRAARAGEVEVVDMLLKNGADPNKVAVNGWNGLHEASRWGRQIQSHSPTLPLSHSPTLPLSHSPTLPLPNPYPACLVPFLPTQLLRKLLAYCLFKAACCTFVVACS